jgi:hypothetical protein
MVTASKDGDGEFVRKVHTTHVHYALPLRMRRIGLALHTKWQGGCNLVRQLNASRRWNGLLESNRVEQSRDFPTHTFATRDRKRHRSN